MSDKIIKCSKHKSLFNRKRYWYHLSNTLKDDNVHLSPWGNDKGFNRDPREPNVERICVAPSIAHCLTAIPYLLGETFNVYKTKERVKANAPYDVYDANITKEGWLQTKTEFVKIGVLDFKIIEMDRDIEHVIPESASHNILMYTGKVLKWWERINVKKYLKPT
jgi:hypothetical protein